MPLYEYECDPCGIHFEKILPISQRYLAFCPFCGNRVRLKISLSNWFMGWNYLKAKSEKSPPAPEDSGYYPEWDEAYKGPQVAPKASPTLK